MRDHDYGPTVAPSWYDPPKGGILFGMHEASELAIAKWGEIARCWFYPDRRNPNERCEIGTGGCGLDHIVYGSADNWLDAARNAGLLE